MIRPYRLAAGALLLSSCSQVPPATHAAELRAPPPALHVSPQREPLRGYRLAESFVARGPFRDGAPLRMGAIVNGLRVRPDASGLRFAESESAPPLKAGVPFPDAWGRGFLFWNDTALYTADSFLGTLMPLFEIGFRTARVSFGPTFALLRGMDGERLAFDLRSRKRVAIAPPLLADIAVTTGGQALALLEGGACELSMDAGKTYQPVPLPTGARATSVREASGQLLANLTSDRQIRVDLAGSVQIEGASRSASPRKSTNALWPLGDPPLERALSFGVPIGEEFAGVAVAGSVATVNLRTGELVQVTRALVPSGLSCRTLDVNGALLLACNSQSNGSVVLSEVFGEQPRTEAKFAADVRLDFAEGVLVASARCDGELRPGAVCVRALNGRTHDFDVSAQLAKLEHSFPAQNPPAKPGAEPVRAAPSIVRWVPKVGGGAVALIGGSTPGLLDAQSGNFVAISPDTLSLASQASRGGSEQWLGLDWIALSDGSVRGWLSNRALAIAADGRLEPSVYEFRVLSGAGAHALAFDSGQRVFQSTDWGRSWVETLGPPGSGAGGSLNFAPRCSLVGCLLGPWLRVGWEAEVPGTRFWGRQVASAPHAVPREALPSLNCEQIAAPVVAEQSQTASESLLLGTSRASLSRDQDYEETFAWLTVHPTQVAGAPIGLRASLAIHAAGPADPEPPPANWPGYSKLARISFVSAFDPTGRIQSASISWRALSDAASAAGVVSSTFQFGQIHDSPSVPVLGRDAGEAEGLILADHLPIWVRGSGAVAAVSDAPVGDESNWISAVQSAPNKLALLGGHADGTLDVVEFTAGRPRRLFQIPAFDEALYPANPDALAIGAQGELAILRTPSGSEPASSADPALLLHPDGSVTVLAPWSRLFMADAPECKPAANDYRAVLQTRRAWLRLIDAAQPVSDQALYAGMFALLRGNSERLCLEAIELADSPLERGDTIHETRLAARFVGRSRGAARLGFDSGFEYRQALSCSLAVAH